MQTQTRQMVRQAASLAMDYWPNSHLGDYSRREDHRSAFLRMRASLSRGDTIQSAAGQVEADACRHMDM